MGQKARLAMGPEGLGAFSQHWRWMNIGSGIYSALLGDPTDVIGLGFLLQSIEAIREGDFELLGRSWPQSNQAGWSQGNPSPDFWFCDPVSGERWPGPERYCFSINYRRPALPLGDVKYVWELNRLQVFTLSPSTSPRLETRSWPVGLCGLSRIGPGRIHLTAVSIGIRGSNWRCGLQASRYSSPQLDQVLWNLPIGS